MKDAVFNEADMPQFLPAGDWRLDIDIYSIDNGVKENIVLVQLYFSVKGKGAKQLLMG